MCILTGSLFAQDPYGRVTGRVTDSSGAFVAGAGIPSPAVIAWWRRCRGSSGTNAARLSCAWATC